MSIGYSGGELTANNENVLYLPNTLSLDIGTPEKNVRPQVAGGGRVVNIVTVNFETAKSMIKFDMASSTANIAQFKEWANNDDANVFTFTPDGGGAPIVFENCTVINKPEITISQDGSFPIEVEGSIAR